jgi:hypothetical protein
MMDSQVCELRQVYGIPDMDVSDEDYQHILPAAATMGDA